MSRRRSRSTRKSAVAAVRSHIFAPVPLSKIPPSSISICVVSPAASPPQTRPPRTPTPGRRPRRPRARLAPTRAVRSRPIDRRRRQPRPREPRPRRPVLRVRHGARRRGSRNPWPPDVSVSKFRRAFRQFASTRRGGGVPRVALHRRPRHGFPPPPLGSRGTSQRLRRFLRTPGEHRRENEFGVEIYRGGVEVGSTVLFSVRVRALRAVRASVLRRRPHEHRRSRGFAEHRHVHIHALAESHHGSEVLQVYGDVDFVRAVMLVPKDGVLGGVEGDGRLQRLAGRRVGSAKLDSRRFLAGGPSRCPRDGP